MPATFAMTVRLPVPLKERLEQAAEQRGDSQNNIVIRATEHDLDGLDGFTVSADWGNDGSASLSMTHEPCGWWMDDEPGMAPKPVHGYPFEGSAPLASLVSAARRHREECEA